MSGNLTEGILDHLLASIGSAPLRPQPFAHIFFESAFPESVYSAMVASLPPADLYEPANSEKYALPDGRCSRQVLDLKPVLARLPESQRDLWTSVHSALASPELRHLVCKKLRITEKGFAVPRLVHDLPGYWIEPHPDSRAKHATMQFYLAPDDAHEELGTTLYRLRPFRPAAWLGREPFMQEVDRFPFRPNAGYAFGVRWNSFHGVERIEEGSGERHSLMNIYYRSAQPGD